MISFNKWLRLFLSVKNFQIGGSPRILHLSLTHTSCGCNPLIRSRTPCKCYTAFEVRREVGLWLLEAWLVRCLQALNACSLQGEENTGLLNCIADFYDF